MAEDYDLFAAAAHNPGADTGSTRRFEPLAQRMRPRNFQEFVGQQQAVGAGKFLRRMIEADNIPSLILYGPPGTGKTTLAQMIAGMTGSHFQKLNAVSSGISDIRDESDRNGTYRKLSVSSQHYAFVVNAFTEFVAKRNDESCDFTLRETRTADVIDDVRTFRSDIGVLYLSTYNERVLKRRLDEANLRFVSLFRARPHVFMREGHPLAGHESLRVQDLEEYPRYTFEQGPEGSLYYSEEPLSSLPHRQRITVSDRATMTSLLRCYDGFLVSTGVRSDEMLDGIVAIPLDVDEVMNVGYVVHRERKLSSLAQAYISELNQLIMGCADKNALVPSKEVTRANAASSDDGAAGKAEGTAAAE